MSTKSLIHPLSSGQTGFTLPLMAVLIVVLTMVAATAMLENDVNRKWGSQVEMQSQMVEISNALRAFQRSNHRLPCVAPLTLAANTAVTAATSTGTTPLRNGQELPECSHASGLNATLQGTRRINVGGRFVRIGALPTQTLGISPSLGIDKWKSRILYAVSEELTDAYLFASSTGRITIQRGATIIMSDAAYAIISHGPNRKGAFASLTGATAAPCTGSGFDIENCDTTNAVFADNDIQFELGTTFNDDIISYQIVDSDAKVRNRPCTVATSGIATWSNGAATCTNASWANMLHGSTPQDINRTGGASSSGTVRISCNNGTLNYIVLVPCS